MSGIRKPSPISTSWPRETTTSRPAASALTTSTSAAALLATASPASAPVSSAISGATASWRDAAPAGREVELEVRVAARHGDRRGQRLGRQRRPAEVRVDDHAGGVQHPAEVRAPPAPAPPRRSPPRRLRGRRTRSRTGAFVEPAAHRATATSRPARAASSCAAGSRRIRSTDGRLRRSAMAEVYGSRRARPDLRGRARGGAWRARRADDGGGDPPAGAARAHLPHGARRPAPSRRRCRPSPTCRSISPTAPSSTAGGRTRSGRSRR